VKVLIDTQVLLWILTGRRGLSARAREVYLDAASALYFSLAGYWEICVKNSLGKLKLSENWPRVLKTEMHRNGLGWMPILPRHCERIGALPWIHRDPFDRLMVAQAMEEQATILTADDSIRRYDVPTVW
jgi:PIN domain nuclease of toxin-antitoxin system